MRPRNPRARGAAVPVLVGLALGCSSPSPPPVGSPLQPLAHSNTRVPDEHDLAARDLAAAALVGPREVVLRELARLEALEIELREGGHPPTGLVPIAHDLANATLDDPIAYRKATRELLESDDIDEALEHRLEEEVADDPLALGNRRMRDAHVAAFARVFNALVAPASRAVTNGFRSAWGLFRSLLNLAVSEHLADELDFRGRQALAHWKHFLDIHPDSPDAARVVDRVEDTQQRWDQTRRDRAMRSARRAMEEGRVTAVLILTERALRYSPEDGEALELRDEAAAELQRIREERRRALQADPSADLSIEGDAARALAVALLAYGGDIAEAAQLLLASDRTGPLADEARFCLALALAESGESGAESGSWRLLEQLADEDFFRSNMARHAFALVWSPTENPYRAFREARGRDRRSQTAWIFFGPLLRGPRDRDLPRPVEWMIDLPTYFDVLISFPNRLVSFPRLSPWPFGREVAVPARLYLERNPEGDRVREVAGWMQSWQERRGNSIGAYEMARLREPPHSSELEEMREKAAQQAVEGAKREKRRDMRNLLLRRVAREYQGTDAGQKAGELARRQIEESTPQRIRISRGFLEENPEVAGPEGLGLRPELLDGENSNGELHPSGVLLIGGRTLEFHYVAESGDKDDPPATQRVEISEERLARLAALLEETAIRNALEDPDDVFGPDPDRDLFFERARLGVADDPDRRATAESSYAFIGMRERYGLVRPRESILPVELVVQGSLPDMGLGVFPRIRTPKPTPDAVLYR